MALHNLPLRPKQLAYTLTRDDGSVENGNRSLLDMPAEVLDKLYGLLYDTACITKTGTFTCIHPFASTCKKFRKGFFAYIKEHVEKDPTTFAFTSYKAQVVDFKFAHLKRLICKNPNFALGSQLSVTVYHAITTSDIDVERFLSWTKFVAKHSDSLQTCHKVFAMPSPEERAEFMHYIGAFTAQGQESNWKTKEIEAIVQDFRLWWDYGARKYEFLSPAVVEKMGVDLPAYLAEIEHFKWIHKKCLTREELTNLSNGQLEVGLAGHIPRAEYEMEVDLIEGEDLMEVD